MLPIERLEQIKKRESEIHGLLADPGVSQDPAKIQALGKELSKIEPIVKSFDLYQSIEKELLEAEQLLRVAEPNSESAVFYSEEKNKLLQQKSVLENELEEKLLGDSDETGDKNIIVEIRAGTGGEEAALFVKDLFRMYTRYAAEHGFAVDVMNTSPTGKGGFKEIIFGITGDNVYSVFKYESGIHRVQRVPETEASGRIHTSASTVAVLLEADEVEVEIKPEELRIDVCRASGPGGQGVNTTDSAVQILHVPTGLVVRCQDERSQLKNKAKAMRVLRARLFQQKKETQEKEISENRKRQVGTGDRSGKIRTYNFPDGRVTDHRIGLTLHNLGDILSGQMDELIDALRKVERARKLSGAGGEAGQ